MENSDTLYARWLSGDLKPEEIEALKQSGDWEALNQLIQATNTLELPTYQVDDAFQKFKEKHAPQTKVISLFRIATAAASVVCLITFSIWWYLSPTKYYASPTTNQSLLLPDQSSVVVNDGSTIQFSKARWNQKRKVRLNGEAYFKVEKGKTFTVITTNGTVEVVGTAFNVRTWDNQLEVTCYEGKVKVGKEGQSKSLGQGQSIIVAGTTFSEPASISFNVPPWIRGQSNFKDATLAILFDELERQYGIKANVPLIDLPPLNISFTHQNLNLALQQICAPLGLMFSIDESNKTVTIQKEIGE